MSNNNNNNNNSSTADIGDGGGCGENNKIDNDNNSNAIKDFRQRGNYEFSQGNYDHAVSLYTAAIEVITNDSTNNNNNNENNEEEMILNLCNRSACYYQQEEYELSKNDAKNAWETSNYKSVKAAYRLAKTCMALKEYNIAKSTIQAALRVLDDQELQRDVSNSSNKVDSIKPSLPDRREEDNKKKEKQPVLVSTTNNDKESTSNQLLDTAKQRNALQELWKQVLEAAYINDNDSTVEETSIKYVKRPISIKEFILSKELGHGNFSEIITVTHKITNEQFALKKIEKKQAADLYKRQHPNVYNEIQMERRVLLERLVEGNKEPKPHKYIIHMYHAFQDYNNLYYLMDLHNIQIDLWSHLRYKNLPGYGDTNATPYEKLVMMGCHRSLAKIWLYELIDAIEYMHKHGIVHRDLKAENILLNQYNHIVVIDFGTAKDLLYTELNGPEFVGTPDFMSPEAVIDDKYQIGLVTGPEADLWALGAITYVLQTGFTPYWSPSPYMAFLKIKRSILFNNIYRPMGIIEDECWDFITQLMQGDPSKRLGSNVFTVEENNNNNGKRKMVQNDTNGYNMLRQHPYFTQVHAELNPSLNNEQKHIKKTKSIPIPSLVDLCIRATAEMVYRNSLDLDLCDMHPPGDGSKHDILRLDHTERNAIMHCLDRRRLLHEPRIYGRFFNNTVSTRLDKIRTATHDVVGLTQMNDDQGKPPKAQMHDQYAKPIQSGPVQIVYITNPILTIPNDNENNNNNNTIDEDTKKVWMKQLKKCISNINRTRPHLVVVTGNNINNNKSVRKALARISETIPVVAHDGSTTTYCTFWIMGVQCIALQHIESSEQTLWLRQQLEQVRMSKHPLFVFVNNDPMTLSQLILKKLARGRCLCLFGLLPCNNNNNNHNNHTSRNQDDEIKTQPYYYKSKFTYEANETIDDNISIRSTDSDEDADKDSFTMKVRATCQNGLHLITVEDEPDVWNEEFQPISLD